MGGVTSGMGGEVSVTSFTTQVFDPNGTRLDVVAIWRGSPEPDAEPTGRWHAPEGWSGSASKGGQREVLFHEQQRRVRVAGSEFTVPNGRMLVLLIDESPGESAPRVATWSIPAPVHHYAEPDFTLPKPRLVEWAFSRHRAEQEVWSAALNEDEVVRRFLTHGTWPGAT
jgi:hypothetical protein